MKTLYIYLISLLTLLIGTKVQAQDQRDYKIQGKIIDSTTQKPLDKITVTINSDNQKDLQAVSNQDGTFEFTNIKAANYKLKINGVGFKSLIMTIQLKADTNLGPVPLKPDMKALGEVSIKAAVPLIQQKPGKIIYDMQADPESKAKSLLDMLHKIPFITVDADDNVSLKGNTNFKVFINGKPSAMMDNNLKAVLRTMPASSIQRIEVITNPPAKYDAEGVGGIINIITVKSVDNGYRGNLNVSERFPDGGPNAGGSITVKDGKFAMNAYGGLGVYDDRQTNFSNSQQSFGNDATLLDQNGYKHNNNRNGYIGTELSYEIDSLRLLSGQFSYNGYHNDGASFQSSLLTGASGVLQGYDINNDNNSHGQGGDASVNYQLGFKADKNRLLTFSYRYAGYKSNAFSALSLANEVNYTIPDYQQPNSASTSEHTFQVDLNYPVKKVMIEAGAKAILRSDRSNSQYLQVDSATSLYQPVADLANQFYYTQDVYSLYNSYQFNLKKWNFSAGLRAEETVIDAHFLSSNSSVSSNYLNVVPSISINHPLGSGGVGLAFNQRIQRPGIYRLNPFIDRSNPNFIVTGNPRLKPNSVNAAQLNYSTGNSGKVSLFVATDYIFVNNFTVPVTNFDPSTQITTVTYQNSGHGHGMDFIFNLNYNVTPKYSISFNSNSTKFSLTQAGDNTAAASLDRWMTMEELSNTLKLDKGWSFNAAVRYNGLAPTSIQGYTNAYFSSNVGLNKELVQHKLYFGLSVNNPFTKFRNIVNTTNGPDFVENNINQAYFRSVSVSLNYNFGKLNGDVKRSRKSINNNDSNNNKGL
jgi:ferric enterobactin receptor